MTNSYDFLCGIDFTWVKIALGNDDYHTIKVAAKLAKVIDLSGGLKNAKKIVINECPKFNQILWPENVSNIKHLAIGNCSLLSALDLSALVNLEELSIINCKQLTNIQGLGEQIRSINIQGCKLAKLDLSPCKKIQDFILTTNNSNLSINFNGCDSLESVIIHVDGIITHQPDSIYRNKNEKVTCLFSHCSQLHLVKIRSINVPTDIEIIECPSLQTDIFLLGEQATVTRAPVSASDTEADWENKTAKIDKYLIESKKNALKVTEHLEDIETVIQENGISPQKKKSCLVKIGLLMRPSAKSCHGTDNKRTVPKDNGGVIDNHSNFQITKYADKNEVSMSRRVNNKLAHRVNWISSTHYLAINLENKSNKIEYPFKSTAENNQYPVKGTYINAFAIAPFRSLFNEIKLNKPNPSIGVPIKKTKPLLKISNSAFTANKNEKSYIPFLGIKEEFLTLYDFHQVEKSRLDSQSVLHIGNENEKNNLSVVKGKDKPEPQDELQSVNKTKSASDYLTTDPDLVDYVPEPSALSAPQLNKDLDSRHGLSGTTKEKATGEELTADTALITSDAQEQNLSTFDFDSRHGLTGAAKEKATGEELTVNAALITSDAQEQNLSTFDFDSRHGLTGAAKEKATGEELTANAALITSDELEQNLSTFDFDSQHGLTGTAKEKAKEEELTANAALIASDALEQNLSTLDFNSRRGLTGAAKEKAKKEELTANAALVTSDALEQNLSTLDFNSRRGLTGAAKEKAKKEELTANAALVTSDALEQNLSTLDFNSQRGLTGTDKEKAKGEELTANAVLITPDSESNALSALTIQESQAKTESEEINFDFHVVRALVDLKPLDVEGFTDEFTSLFIKDFYDQVINRIRDEFDSQVDWSSEKRLQAEGQFVTADPELIVEEENSNSLFSLSIKEKCPGKDEVLVTDNEEFNYDFHVVRALVDLKPLDAERFNDDFNTFYLADLNERIHKKIEKELIRDDLIAAEKTKAENEHLIVAPTLSSYEEGEETALCNLTIKKEIFAQEPAPDEIDFEYHVVRALVDLKPDNMEQFNHDFTSFYLSELNQQIVDSVKKELAQRELIRVEKTQSAGEYLTAAPTLTDYEQENSSLLAFLYQNTDDAFEDYNTLDLDRFTSNLTATVTDLNKQVISSFRELPQSQSEADATTDQVSRADSLSDTDLELDKVYETDDFDVADFLDTPDLQLSDDMQDLLDSLTEEERELLFPQGKGLSSSTVLLNALFPITPDPNSEINLKRVNDNQVKQLLEFFDSQAILGIKSWAKDVIYTFADGTEFHFKHDVFQRARKVTHEGVRYEVISNKALLGEGGFGKIRRVKGTVALDAEQELIQFKQQGSDGKRRVVKVQEHSKYSNPLEDYTRGLEFAKRAGHLAIKEPTVVDNATIMTQTSYTVMDQINGRDLFDVINDDLQGLDVLSTQERIELARALLWALKEQVTDRGIIHRDIKPENIMVDLGPPISVTIIDYDLSIDTPDGQFAGTEGFFAPECLNNPMEVSPKSDNFSLGRVLEELGMCDIPDLDETNKLSIQKIVAGMLEEDPNQRLSIDETIEAFAYIDIEGSGVPYSHWLWDNNWIDGEFVPDALLESIQAADTRLAADEVGEAQQTHEGDKDTDEFDVAAFLASDTQPTEEMQDLLDSLTEEERELLFPRDKELSAKTLLFDDVPRVTNYEHNLFDIILDDYDGIDVLSTDERIELSQALLLALKEQVSDQGFIHQDIRPENIIVRLGSPISVTIINEDLNTREGQFAGTEGYYAPEFLSDPMAVSPKANVYALGRVLALIWRVDFTTYRDSSPYTPDSYRPQDLLVGIGDDIPDLDENNKSSIRKILSWMLENDPNQRLSIDEAIEVFAYIGGEGVPYSHWLWDNNWIDGEFVPDALLESIQAADTRLAADEVGEAQQTHEGDKDTDEFDVAAFLASDTQPTEEMQDLLDSLTEEERELLFPRDKELSAKTLLFDDVPRATNHEHNLFDIILDDYDGIDVLSTDERIELSQALLLALKEQVSDQGFIHQDIRPENIIVRLGSPISVTIINEDVDTPEGQFAGTEGYYPPEFLSDPMAVSPKANVYALGRVLALIWRVDFTTYRDSSPYTPDSYRPQDLLVGIGDDIPDLDENNKSSIRKILSWMLENDPNQRLSIDEAIEVFAYIGGEGVPYSHWLWDNNWIDGEFVPDALLEARQGTEVALATGEIIEERQVHQVDNSLDSISEPLIEVNPLDKVNDEPRELEKPSVSDHAKGIEKTDSKISSGNFRFFQPETSSSIDLSLREKRHKNF